jgi:mannose-1-phosphate guanylyltransferase
MRKIRAFPRGFFRYTAAVMTTTDNTYALILAGGSGTRFWPLSRNSRPKQLLDLFGDGTLLEQTIRRLDGLVPLENILILTNAAQEAAVREIASMLPAANIIAEPAKRDTAPAVALGVGLIAARNPNALMMVLPSDQLIRDTAGYQAVMRDALATAALSSGLVTIGIRPTWACPSYGYVERGEPANLPGFTGSTTPFTVKRFREKPDPELAATFLASGGFSWNAGIFVWSLPTVIAELARHTPELAAFIAEIQHSTDHLATIASRFPALTPISIDFALMEHAQCVFNLEATFDWDDVGSWLSIAKYLTQDPSENSTNAPLTVRDANHNIVFNASKDVRIALLGVDNLIIVQTADALLIADRNQADSIKKLTDLLPGDLL